MYRKDLKPGDKFGEREVIQCLDERKNGYLLYLVKCPCGDISKHSSTYLKQYPNKLCKKCSLKKVPRKGTSNPFYRHGFAKTAKKGSVYNTWASMRARCNNPNDNQYKDYGGRGIKVCPEWNDFMTFYKDVGERPEGHQLDRIDNDKNYCKENCRWADVVTQANNRRTTTFFSVENRKIARADLERELEISHEHFRRRLERYAIQVLQNKELSWDELRKIFKN